MQTLLKFPITVIGIVLIAIGCDNNDWPLKTIPVVQFESVEGTTDENSGEKTIVLTFNKAFEYDASINLLVDASKAKYFSSTPAIDEGVITLEVKKYDQRAFLKITPKDNATSDGTKLITFQITRLHNEFILGDRITYSLLIEDNE